MATNWKDGKFLVISGLAIIYPFAFSAVYLFLETESRDRLREFPRLLEAANNLALILVFAPVLVAFWWLPIEGKRKPFVVIAVSLVYLACLFWPWRYLLQILSFMNGESP